MNYSNLIAPLVFTGFLLLLSMPSYLAETAQHDHRQHYIPMNDVKGTAITVCIVEGDTVAQVTGWKGHIDYDVR